MTYSSTYSVTQTFTVTHAKYLAAKVAADLKRIQRFYNRPSDVDIADYETELIELLRNGYLESVSYGFKRDGNFIEPTLMYKAQDLTGLGVNDDDPGKIKPGADVSGAGFYSFLTYSATYFNLSSSEKENFKKSLPFNRANANEPGVNGYLSADRTYSSGGRELNRSSIKSY